MLKTTKVLLIISFLLSLSLTSGPIEFQRASGSTGLSHSIDIGSAGNDRLVVVIAVDESTGTSLTNVTVDGKNCTKAGEADNPDSLGNHQELWYILEETLGSSNGTVTVTCTGGDAGWATHVHVYYGVNQSTPYDFEVEEAIVGGTTISVENVSSLNGSVVIFSACQGTGGLTPSWTSPLTVRTNGPDPSSTDLATASNIESTGQTNKTYVCTWNAAFNRGTGIVAVWEPSETTPTPIRIFDNAIFNAYPPPYVCTLSVASTDPQSDDIQYEIQWDTDYGFSSASSETTGTYPSGDTIIETILLGTAAEAETLFYWKARARDPGGSNVWSDWSETRSFTMDMDLGEDFPYWYQVAKDQFDQCTKYNVTVQGDSVVLSSTVEIEFQRASGSTGLSHSIDIGSAGNNRLVVVIAVDESTGTSLTNVTVDGKNCTKAGEADNPDSLGNHQELWYILEETLGSSNGTVTVTCTGGDAGWATHVHVYYGVNQSTPYDFEVEEAIVGGTTISVENVSSLNGSVVIFSACQGTGGLTPSWTSPLTVRTNGPDPSSTDLATASNIESTGQTNKTYVCTWNAAFNRGTGIVAVWEPSETNEGTLTSHPIAYNDLTTENSNRSDWDGAKWTKSSAYDSIGLQVQYLHGGSWDPVPDGDLPGNSNYIFQMDTFFCNVDLSGLNTTTYDTLRLQAKLIAYNSTPSPALMMWALGQTGGVTSVPLSDDELKFALYLPNPNLLGSGTGTEIKYQIPKEVEVKLGVFDLLGREVATFVNGKQSRGTYSVRWSGTNNYNKRLACGIYFLRIEAGGFRDVKKLVFLY